MKRIELEMDEEIISDLKAIVKKREQGRILPPYQGCA